MNLYLKKEFRPVFALFFAVLILALIQFKLPIHSSINSSFIITVNSILFMISQKTRQTTVP